jgi:hypothetical protein
MASEGIVSRLAEGLIGAQERASLERAKGREPRMALAVIRSLRRTLASIVQLRDPRVVGATGFLLTVSSEGEPVVRHVGRTLLIPGSLVRELFKEAGAELGAGQVILLDPEVAKSMIEDALAALSREEAGLREEKSKLLQAYLAADTSDGASRSGKFRPPSEVA